MTKVCKICTLPKDIENFAKAKTCKDGRRGCCNLCRGKKLSSWYFKNKVQIAQKQKQYAKNNKIIIMSYTKLWKKNNVEKVREYLRKWQRNNTEKVIANNAKRRAQKIKATPKWLTKEQLCYMDNYYKLAKKMQQILNIPMNVDHIIPLRGKNVCGLHVPWNLQILSATENFVKNNRY